MNTRYYLELLSISLLLASCNPTTTGRIYDRQIIVEHKGSFAKECIDKECVCYSDYGLNRQTDIPCLFYNKIEAQNER